MTALAIPNLPLIRPHADAASGGRAQHPEPPRLSVDDLRDLMQAVSDTTDQLQSTHLALHAQVTRLQQELAEANAALRRSQSLAALGEMAAGIAHEIRNPLGSIQLYVQMLNDDLQAQPEQAALCSRIGRAVAGLDAIVRDVLSFAREARISRETATPNALFEEALLLCNGLIASQRVTIQCDRSKNLAFKVDARLLGQALANVIRNAIEAMDEAGTPAPFVRLSAHRGARRLAGGSSAAHIVLRVEDCGPGIPVEVRSRIFNPFFTTRAAGTGLGLAIVHRIIDAHGGHIDLGDAEPHGSIVSLCIPESADAPDLHLTDAVDSRDD